MIYLNMLQGRHATVLREAGYRAYPNKITFTLEKDFEHTWHAQSREGFLEIHMNKIYENDDRVVFYRNEEIKEKKRLVALHNKLFPPYTDPKLSRIDARGEFAPNLRELQKAHKTAILSDAAESVTE